MRRDQVVVGDVGVLAAHEQGRDPDVLERRWLRGHLAVRCDHRRLAVAVAPATVLVLDEEPLQILDHMLPRGAGQEALDEPPLDALLERRVRPVAAVLLRHEERDLGRDQDRRVEEHEPLDELGTAAGDLEGEPGAEGVADPCRRLVSDRLEHQANVLVDAPGRLVGRRAVAEQIGRDHVAVREPPLGHAPGAAAVPRDAVEADDPRIRRITPRLDVELAAHGCSSRASSDSGTISVRFSSLTSDQITTPSLSIRNVPRLGAPVSSLKTPYARAAAPCCQKSEAKA